MKQIPEDIIKKLNAVIRRIEVAAAFDGIGNEDFNLSTSVGKLAEISGMSERSLRDYFKTFTGKSLVKYTSARRAEYAARIFRLFPQISKSEVARIIGFNCPNGIYSLMRKNGVVISNFVSVISEKMNPRFSEKMNPTKSEKMNRHKLT